MLLHGKSYQRMMRISKKWRINMAKKEKKRIPLIIAAALIALVGLSPAPASVSAASVADTVKLSATELVPIGRTAGILISAGGAYVSGFSDVGTLPSPAKTAGIKEGDLIIALGSRDISSVDELSRALDKNGTLRTDITVLRDGKTVTLQITPASDGGNGVKIGAYVRDTVAGVGTITFYDPSTGVFGALGHGITDSATGTLIPLARGNLTYCTITSVKKGAVGIPGELVASFNGTKRAGSLYSNSETGVFGTMKSDELYPEQFAGKALPVASPDEVVTGPAEILANIQGEEVRSYKIEIIKIINSDRSTKNMQIRVTDSDLLALTGGIVQGMSGSPIIQNGKIVGAVTHVLVDDPTKGYGIFIVNMLSKALPTLLDKAA